MWYLESVFLSRSTDIYGVLDLDLRVLNFCGWESGG